jgi:hypothetical protein
MKCVICGGQISYHARSLAEPLRGIFYCGTCPMTYSLLLGHEVESLQLFRERCGDMVAAR